MALELVVEEVYPFLSSRNDSATVRLQVKQAINASFLTLRHLYWGHFNNIKWNTVFIKQVCSFLT